MTLENRFPGKRAFITGAASGLGLAIAKHLAVNGWKLLIADIHGERLALAEKGLKALGADTRSISIDVSNYSELENAADLALQTWGGIDMVFNNAGIASAGKMEEISLDDWKRLIDVDLWSVIYGCKVFIPILKKQGGGYIVNTASSAGTLAGAEMANYNVAKAGVVSLSETLKVELSGNNIGVTVICPTIFKTGLGESLKSNKGMQGKLMQQLEQSTVTSEDIVADVMATIEKNKLYVMTQADANWAWRFKRFFPETYLKLMSYMYRNKKWIFAE